MTTTLDRVREPVASRSTQAVASVSVLSTGTIQIHPQHAHGGRAPMLEAGRFPGVGDAPALREASAMVSDLRSRLPGLAILQAHDPRAAERLARADGVAR